MAANTDLPVAGPREGRRILIRPVRQSLSRAGWVVGIYTFAGPALVVLGVAAIFSAQGVAIPDIPAGVRQLVVGVALAPGAIILVAELFGPLPGLKWLFEPAPGLIVDSAGLQLLVGDQERWTIRWEAIDSLGAVGFPERLELRQRDGPPLDMPRSLNRGRIAGTGQPVDVVTLIADEVKMRRQDVPSEQA